jgi:hypothetical protein
LFLHALDGLDLSLLELGRVLFLDLLEHLLLQFKELLIIQGVLDLAVLIFLVLKRLLSLSLREKCLQIEKVLKIIVAVHVLVLEHVLLVVTSNEKDAFTY